MTRNIKKEIILRRQYNKKRKHATNEKYNKKKRHATNERKKNMYEELLSAKDKSTIACVPSNSRTEEKVTLEIMNNPNRSKKLWENINKLKGGGQKTEKIIEIYNSKRSRIIQGDISG